MLYWKHSPNRIYFLNEYWICVATMILVYYIIIRKIRSDKKKEKEKIELLKRLKNQIEHQKRLRQILFLSLSMNGCAGAGYGYLHLLNRGGSDFINVDHINNCWIEEGVRYLNDARLKNIIHDLYRYKRKGEIVFITATALCHLVERYGKKFLNLPVTIGDFGFTNFYQATRKFFVTALVGSLGPLLFIGTPAALTLACVLGAAALKLASIDLDRIPTSLFTGSVEDMKSRIPYLGDVVVLNNRNKMVMTKPIQQKEKVNQFSAIECWLPEQAYLNPNCQPKDLGSPNLNLDYKQVGNQLSTEIEGFLMERSNRK